MPAPYFKDRYDIGVLRADGSTKVGLMLRRDKNGNPVYQVYDDEYLASQMFTGEPGYSNLPPEKELAIRQDDWRSGLGQEIMDDSKRYHRSTMDMRFKGAGYAGWKSTAIAVTSATVPTPTIVNGDMELTTGWTNGARSNTFAHGGTYSWYIVGGAA